MGQYYKVVNLDKKQFINPHAFGDGLKLLEFGCSADGTLTGLAVLLANGNGRGGGDLRSENPIIGSWAGDRIVIAGDYGDQGLFVDNPEVNLYEVSETFEDISDKVIAALADDAYIKQSLQEKTSWITSEPVVKS